MVNDESADPSVTTLLDLLAGDTISTKATIRSPPECRIATVFCFIA